MRRSIRAVTLTLILSVASALSLAACSSSGGSGPQPPGGGSSSPPTSTQPSTTSGSATVPTTSAPPTKPLSPFEKDPAVQALRAWAAQLARTINSGHVDGAKLRALMTPALAKTMQNIAGAEVGGHYPGPLPFTPVGVRVDSASSRDVHICIVAKGFSINPKTSRPYVKHVRKLPIDAGAVRSNGRWLVSKFDTAGFACSSVKVAERKW